MKQSPQIKARIDAIAKELMSGKERAYILPKYAKKWQLSQTSIDRYITNAKGVAIRRANLIDKVANDTVIEETREAVRNGIKTKNERILILQNEVDKCLHELYGGPEVKNFADFGGSRKNVKDQLTVLEKVKLRQVMNQLQTEISKIEGDYAPEKSEGELILTWQENKTYKKK